ncbi:3-keto-disaccharide hydrolase [Maribellus mangrovi]|uniref:3-keto-disaccharide hydrolase n=1 Tax=Maribellus mangrovi TaxID=3133146 RepID=UPI0030EEC310
MKKLLFVLLLSGIFTACSDSKEYLFNGKDLDNWVIYLEDDSILPENFFYVKNGVIETPGVPLGYARTKKEYSNYKLHVEWRYPEEPVNSGVMLHVNPPDMIWIEHYQGQLKYLNAGDFIVHGVNNKATLNDTVYTSTETEKPLIPKMQPTNETPAGEWNSYDIVCKDDTIELYVNGLLQNVATDCSTTKGSIGLQAEGSKIQFRNMYIEPL